MNYWKNNFSVFGLRKFMDRVIEALEKKHAIKIFLLFFTDVPYKEKLRKDLEIPTDTIDARLKDFVEVGLLEDPKKQNDFPFRVTYPITNLGKEISRKLNYVFDETKEVYPISKEIIAQLKEYAKLEGVTWQELVSQAIQDILHELKDKRPLKVGKT